MGNDIGINSYTLAVITTDKNMNTSGGCPIFYANDDDDLQKKVSNYMKNTYFPIEKIQNIM